MKGLFKRKLSIVFNISMALLLVSCQFNKSDKAESSFKKNSLPASVRTISLKSQTLYYDVDPIDIIDDFLTLSIGDVGVSLQGHFTKSKFVSYNNIELVNECDLQYDLTSNEEDRLNIVLSNLKTCEWKNLEYDPMSYCLNDAAMVLPITRITNSFEYMYSENESVQYYNRDNYNLDDMTIGTCNPSHISWLCDGKEDLYSFLQELLDKQDTSLCPEGFEGILDEERVLSSSEPTI